VVGLARNPGGEWMKQMARNLIDVDDGFLRTELLRSSGAKSRTDPVGRLFTLAA
jgi:hypothetical protein